MQHNSLLLPLLQLAALLTVASCFSASTKTLPVSIEPRRNVASPDDEKLRQMQQIHRPIVESFVPSEFNPHPALTNKHLQTIAGVFLRKNLDCAYVTKGVGGVTKVLQEISSVVVPTSNKVMLGDDNKAIGDDPSNTFWDERQRITTSCEQDFFSVDIKYASERKTTYQSVESNGLVIIIHGLESNSNSSLSTDMASAYDGYDVCCINFRGCCGSGPNKSLGGYHLGFTDDLRHFLKLISTLWDEDNLFDKRPIYLSGFSLGANVVVKCLGELGDAALTLYNVQGAAVCGAPFDAERNIIQLDSPGFNRAIYSGNFLKTLKKRAQFQLEQHCDGDPNTNLFDYQGVMDANTVAEFDNGKSFWVMFFFFSAL
jgi:predicted alpha/beta-fold hydrolase